MFLHYYILLFTFFNLKQKKIPSKIFQEKMSFDTLCLDVFILLMNFIKYQYQYQFSMDGTGAMPTKIKLRKIIFQIFFEFFWRNLLFAWSENQSSNAQATVNTCLFFDGGGGTVLIKKSCILKMLFALQTTFNSTISYSILISLLCKHIKFNIIPLHEEKKIVLTALLTFCFLFIQQRRTYYKSSFLFIELFTLLYNYLLLSKLNFVPSLLCK